MEQNDRPLRQVTGLREVLARLVDQIQSRPSGVTLAEGLPAVNVSESSAIPTSGSVQLRTVAPQQSENRLSSGNGRPDVASVAASGLNRIFLSPIISGVLRLFSQRSEPAMMPLERFTPVAGGLFERGASVDANGESVGIRRDAYGTAAAGRMSPTPVQISIQALDARSILERSGDIAQAVRQAMLSNHEINSELGEL